MSIDGQVVSLKSHQIGLRSIRVVQEKDKDGQSFYFEVNGPKVYSTTKVVATLRLSTWIKKVNRISTMLSNVTLYLKT